MSWIRFQLQSGIAIMVAELGSRDAQVRLLFLPATRTNATPQCTWLIQTSTAGLALQLHRPCVALHIAYQAKARLTHVCCTGGSAFPPQQCGLAAVP